MDYVESVKIFEQVFVHMLLQGQTETDRQTETERQAEREREWMRRSRDKICLLIQNQYVLY